MANSTMDAFCGSTFWDTKLAWNSTDPDLTPCFEKTVLVWVPCLFLWTFSVLEVYYILNSKKRDIPWNFLNISKSVLTALIIILTICDIVTAVKSSTDQNPVSNVDIYSPLVKILTFALTGVFLLYNRKHGLRTSGLLFLFWLVLGICGTAQLRSEILLLNRGEIQETDYAFISYIIYYCLVVLIFFLNCFADQAPRISKYPKVDNPCPEEGSSFLSRLLFAWFDSLAWTGFRNPLETKNLWTMNPEDCAPEVVPLFDKYWRQTVEKCGSSPVQASFKTDSGRVDFQNQKKKKQASILPALCKAFGPTFLFGAFLKLLQDLLTFVSPQILRLLIDFIEGKEPDWKGYIFAILMLLTAIIQTLILSQYFNRMFLVGMRIRTALISAIYRKAMCMSNSARKESTVGEIVNLMSVDAQRFMELTAYLNMIWSAPLQIALALYFLWETLGPSVLAGLAVMIILIPINGYIANKVKDLQIRQMKNKDERVKLMNEVLSGIKVLKLYAWEPSFEAQILKIRNKEIKVLKQAAYMNAATSFIWSCAPFLVSLVTFAVYVYIDDNNILTPQRAFVALTLFGVIRMPMSMLPMLIVFIVEVSLVSFATYVLVDENNVLDAKKAFVSLSLFNILRFPLSMLPMMISNMVQASVSIQRINKFMNSEELNPDNVTHDPSEKDPLLMENGTFTWGEEPILRNINLRFPKGGLTAVVGSVGSGKSSLLSAFLGEMEKQNGRVNTVGTIAYVSQQAWIQNATLQDNILFGSKLDKRLYDKIIGACSLKPDLDMLPGGDQTEIGEKGINLSGGQKQRVSLARAVYNNAEIYFLDDPLSAVDSHVGKHIFENVIGPTGILQKKTRVLVTHGITYLPEVDNIVVLKNGEVSEMGTYKELLNKKGDFADFLIQHLQEVNEEEVEEQLEEMKNTLSDALGTEEIRQKLARHRSRVSESVSETGSTTDRPSMNGSLTRQMSSDSTEKSGSLRRRIPEKSEIRIPAAGEKLIEVEKTETGSVKWDVYKHYLRSIGITLSVSTIILNMIFQGFSIGSNLWLSVWSDDAKIVVNGTVDTSKRDMYLGVYGALGIGQAISVFFSSLTLYVGTLSGAKLMHDQLLVNVLRAPSTSFFDITPVGRILNRFAKDVDTVDSVLPMTLRGWTTCFFAVVATLFVISFATPIFVAVIIPIGFVYYFIQRFYVATSRQLKRLESVSRSPIYSHFGESVTGTQTIRAYGVQNRFISESEAKVDFNQVCYYPSIIANRWLAVRLEMVGNLIIFFAALFTVINREDMHPGKVGLSVSYALQITQTLNWLVRMTSDVETNIVAVERIKEYGETNQEAPWVIPNQNVPNSWPEKGTVDFKNYAVRYRPGLDLVLKGVNFTVNGGEKVGIVGRTGAGKSSLTLALFRIIEAADGAIEIDNINIATLGLHALRSRLTIIPQDAVLFSGTLRLNLDPFDTHTDEEVWRALEHAHLKAFVKAFTSFFEDLAPQLGCWFAARAMHLSMLAGILRAPLVFFDTTPQGRILSRFSKDVDVLDTGLPRQISDTIYCCFEVVATLFVISFTTPIFIAVIIPIGFVYYFIQRFYVATSRQLKRLESVSRSPIYSHFGESVTGTQTIRAYGVQNRFISESEAKVDFNQVCYYPSIIANRWLAVRLEMVGNLIIFFAALFTVINREDMHPGKVGLSVSYALQITQTLNWLVRMTSDVETNIVAVERIKEYGETNQEAPWVIPNQNVPNSWPEKGTVDFKNYAVRYRPGLDLVLKGVNFTVNGGEKVGIVGRTGAGKSSLTLALFRIIEAADGAIEIDNINIATLGLHALRSRLTIIPQDAVLFSGTLRLNLDPFDTHTDEEVWSALEHAHLKAFVKGLPAGLNHEVTEGGENLSVGQRQLICLGRALLRKTKVLILDEATAAVDLETDDLIQRTIRTEFSECTILTIAHRLNTILDSDRVIVLDKGQIVEFDSPSNLLQDKNSIFHGMAKDAGLV